MLPSTSLVDIFLRHRHHLLQRRILPPPEKEETKIWRTKTQPFRGISQLHYSTIIIMIINIITNINYYPIWFIVTIFIITILIFIIFITISYVTHHPHIIITISMQIVKPSQWHQQQPFSRPIFSHTFNHHHHYHHFLISGPWISPTQLHNDN